MYKYIYDVCSLYREFCYSRRRFFLPAGCLANNQQSFTHQNQNNTKSLRPRPLSLFIQDLLVKKILKKIFFAGRTKCFTNNNPRKVHGHCEYENTVNGSLKRFHKQELIIS